MTSFSEVEIFLPLPEMGKVFMICGGLQIMGQMDATNKIGKKIGRLRRRKLIPLITLKISIQYMEGTPGTLPVIPILGTRY